MAFSMQSVTTFLKKFLRDLPEPVIPKRYQKSMLYTMTNVSNVLFICSDKQDDFDRLLMLQVNVEERVLANNLTVGF